MTPAVSHYTYLLYNTAVLLSMRIQDQRKCTLCHTTQRRWSFLKPFKIQMLAQELCLIFLGKSEKLLLCPYQHTVRTSSISNWRAENMFTFETSSLSHSAPSFTSLALQGQQPWKEILRCCNTVHVTHWSESFQVHL